jgi:LacI family transcriptional regulator
MLDQEHRQIAYISGPLWKNDARQRLNSHKKALAERRLKYNPVLYFEGNFQETSGVKGVNHLLAQPQEFSALVCGNDEMAAGAMDAMDAMDAIRTQGLQIPGDISIIGFDNLTFAHYTYPKLNTIDYPIYSMGKMSAQWVLKNAYKKTTSPLSIYFSHT